MDSIVSLFNLMATFKHNSSLTDDEFDKSKPLFDQFLSEQITLWRDFYSYWMDEPLIPTYIVRFEDLLSDTKNTLLGMFRFMLNEEDLEGTLIETLIEHHTKSKAMKQVYKPRKGKINANKHFYTDSQIKLIK